MAEQITVNMENLSAAECSQLMQMVEKANKPKTKVWKPAHDENYYYVDDSGKLWLDDWVDYVPDEKRWKLGNVYKTTEQAQFATEKQLVLAELQRYAAEHNEGEIDWGNTNRAKVYIGYSYDDKYIATYDDYSFKSSYGVYFTSEEIAKQALQSIGRDRILKYLFEVEN